MEIKSLLSNLSKKGFFHIFSADIINKIIGFGNSFILIHILSKTVYGEWSYAMNNLSFFLLISGMGINNGILYYGALSKKQEERQEIFKFGLGFGTLFNLVIGILVFLSTYILPYPIEGSITILRMLSLLPVLYIIQSNIQAYLRANFKNKEFSYIISLNSICLLTFIVVGSIYFGIIGVVYAFYLSYSISIFAGLILYLKSRVVYDKVQPLTFAYKKDILKYSATCSLTNAISSLLYLLDVLLVGLILKDEAILASYKTATLIPFGLNFIPLSIMTFAAPYFINMSRKYDELKYHYITMKKYLVFINFIISSTLFILAPFVVKMIFGEEYLDSVLPFRILVIGYFIAGTFRIPNGNVIANMGRVKFNLIVAMFSSTLNIILDILLISEYGSVGAAIATVCIFIVTSLLTEIYLAKTIGIKPRDYLNQTGTYK